MSTENLTMHALLNSLLDGHELGVDSLYLLHFLQLGLGSGFSPAEQEVEMVRNLKKEEAQTTVPLFFFS